MHLEAVLFLIMRLFVALLKGSQGATAHSAATVRNTVLNPFK